MKLCPSKWDEFGKQAGYIRNREMIDFARDDSRDAVLIAFWDGKSRGTLNTVTLAEKYNFDVHIIRY